MSEQLKPCEAFIKEVLEVAEHLQVDNGLLTATEQYDLGEQLYSAVEHWNIRPTPDVVEDYVKCSNCNNCVPIPTPDVVGDVVERAAANVYGEHNDHDHLGNSIPWESASPQRKEIMRRRAKAALSALPQGKALPCEDAVIDVVSHALARIMNWANYDDSVGRPLVRILIDAGIIAATPQPQPVTREELKNIIEKTTFAFFTPYDEAECILNDLLEQFNVVRKP